MKEKIKLILVLAWFFISLVFMLTSAVISKGMPFISIGQFLFFIALVITIISLKEKTLHNSIVVIGFDIIGLLLILSGIIIDFNIISINSSIEILIPSSCFIISIVCLIQFYIKRNNDIYSLKIKGKVIDAKKAKTYEDTSGHKSLITSYCPIYEITYENKKKIICNNELISEDSINYKEPTIGEIKTLYINPNNFNDFIDDNTKNMNKILLFLGFWFLLFGIITIIIFK